MFHSIPAAVAARMSELERIDAEQRRGELPRRERLCQVPPETGRLLALLAAAAPPGDIVEVGTSGGYSTLWLALAARQTGRRIRTFERFPRKAALARETFARTGVAERIELRVGDARERLQEVAAPAFAFLDAEKEEYPAYLEALVGRMAPGGIVAADNVHSHRAILQPFVDAVLADTRLDALVLPVGKGVLVARIA